MIYFIPESNLHEFEKRIAILIRRAVKLGAKLVYSIDREVFKDVRFEFVDKAGVKSERFIRHIQVTVDGDKPKIAGWSFIGTLEHTTEGNILRLVPDATAPIEFRDKAPECDHCKLKRQRRDTFLVKHDDGKVNQVGSNCLRDFLGHGNPHMLAQLATIWINIEDLSRLAEDKSWLGGGGGSVNVERHDLMRFLSIVAEITLRHGFYSKSAVNAMREKQGPNASVPEVTAHRAHRYMIPVSEDWAEAEKYAPTAPATEMAEQARAWVLGTFGYGLPSDGNSDDIKAALDQPENTEINDFEHNMFVVAKGESVERRTFGIAAYIIQAYRKANNLIPERAPRRPSAHLGALGQRFKDMPVLCEKVFTWNSDQFGRGYRFKLVTPEGNVVMWKTYNVSTENLMEESHNYTVNATVKAHGAFNQEKQTEVSRLKVTSEVPETASGAGATAAAPAPAALVAA